MRENPIRKLRESLGWNQAKLGQAIGRSWQSIQNYEAGKRVPAEVVEKLKTIAAQHGLADLAVELSSEQWQVRRVFHPGEAIISQPRQKAARGAVERSEESKERQSAHQMVDEIYSLGSPELIAAMYQNLTILANYIRLAQGGPKQAKPRAARERP